jgi:hypothetical protein
MEALNHVIAVPSWAYDFCYYYLAVAAIIAVYGVWALIKIFMLPGFVKKFVPMTTLTISIVLSTGLALVLTMMQFWICRSSLRPGAEKFANHGKGSGSMMAEKFAVTCANDADCTAVMGTQPAGSLCSCGGRGFCGGCMMNNNMEPQASFSSDFAPIEGFAPAGRNLNAPMGHEGFAVPMNQQMKKVAMPARRR